MPALPGPTDVVHSLLIAFFGPGATIVLVFVVANFVTSSYGAARSSIRWWQVGAAGARRIRSQAAQIRPVDRAVGVLVTSALVVVQILWLWSSFVAGNGWSYSLTANISPEKGPDWLSVVRNLHWDLIVAGYVVLCVVILVLVYHRAVRGQDHGPVAFVLLAPALFIGFIAFMGGALALALALLNRANTGRFVLSDNGRMFLTLFAVVVAYATSCAVALSTPRMIVDLWRTRSARAHEIRPVRIRW